MNNPFRLTVANPRETPPTGSLVVNVTSQSRGWQRELSPFLLGPVPLYDKHVAKNMENGWQYAKVYRTFLTPDGEISPAYFEWAQRGWDDPRGQRYPMGKGAIPEFSYWNGKRLSYVDARKEIYLPLYAKAVVRTKAFEQLQALVRQQPVTLIDFDVYSTGTTALGVSLHDPKKKFGHGFVLYGLLTGEITPDGRCWAPAEKEKIVSRKPGLLFGAFESGSRSER